MNSSKLTVLTFTTSIIFIFFLSVLAVGILPTKSLDDISITADGGVEEIPEAVAIDANNLDLVNPDMSVDGLQGASKGITPDTTSLGHDTDGDGLTDDEESQIYNTDPLNPDTDGDGLIDGFEVDGWDIEVDSVPQHVTADPNIVDSDGDGLTDYEEAPTTVDSPIHATQSTIIQGSLYCGGLSATFEKDPSFPAVPELGTEGVLGLSGRITEVDYAFVIPSTISVAEISHFSILVAALARQGSSPHDTAWSVQLEDLVGEWQEIRSIPEAPGTWMLDWTYFTSSSDISTYLSDQDRVLRLKLIVGHQMQFVRYLDFLELTLYSLSNSLTNPRNPDTDGDGLVDSFEVEGWDIEVNGVIIHVTADPTMTDSDGDGLTDYEEAPYKEEDFPIHATESNIIQGSLYCGGLSDTYAKDPSFPAIQELGTEGVMGFSRPVTEVDYAFVIPSTISVAEISQFSISVAAIALTLQGRSPHDTAWSVQLEDLFGEWQEIRSIPEAPGTWMLDWTYFPPLSFDISTYLSDQDRVLRLKLIVGHQMELIRYLDFLELTLYRIFGSLTDPRNPDTDGNGISDYDEYFDTVPPIVTLSINDDAPSTNSRSVSLTITATDNSGLAQMRFKNAGEDDWTAWEPFATSRSWMLPSGDGPKMIFVQVSDGVGNIGEGSDTILLQTLLADAGDDQSVNEGTPVSFQGTIINPGAGEPYTFEWDFGDGNTASDALAPTHTYVDDGIYTVTLTVSDADAGVATDTLIVTVLNVAPTASIDAITQLQGFTLAELTVLMLDPVFFTGSAADPGSDDLTFTWDWGDGTSPTVMIYLNDPPSYPVVIEEILEHTYMEPEEYLLTLTVEDDDGGIGTATVTLTVWGPRNLKINVTSELEALKTGEKCLDRRLNRIIGYIELSLNEKYWVNATHLTSQYGYCVFLYELFAEIHLQIHNELYNHLIPVLEKWIEHLQAQGSDTTWLEEKLARMRTLLPVFESALYKLAKADELLARVAIMDAEDMPVQNPKWQQKVDHLLTKTHEHMMKSAEYVENGQFIAAISHYKVAWKFAQDALKWAIKSN